MFNIRKLINKKKIPEYSIFGFKILNAWHSIFCSYILIISEFLISPYFGIDGIEKLAGSFFIFLNNSSIIILIINSLIRIKKSGIYFIILIIPLLIYIPFSFHKLFLLFEWDLNVSLRFYFSAPLYFKIPRLESYW